MRIVVCGATGTLGRLICARAADRGPEVVPVSRSEGVDVISGDGLEAALTGADVVVDALNIETLSRRRAVRFFSAAAGQIASAARRAGVGRVVCVSIAGAAEPAVHRYMGYYRGKAAQEQVYAEADVDTTIVLSTQWFELMDQLVRRASLGPFTVLPTMRMAPLAAESAA
ncbi:MAG: NAD(P)H-binding protein, partial [Micrococcus sp.]|nr:NAD(P)H-binding protein [Micrococcus sp.]